MNTILEGAPVSTTREDVAPGGIPAADRRWDFFISYASPDRESARDLYRLLTPAFRVFFDTESLPVGLPFDRPLIEALNASRITVVLVSKASKDAFFQREEVLRAISLLRRTHGQHRVVPLFLDGCGGEDATAVVGSALLQGIRVEPGGMAEAARRLARLIDTPDDTRPEPRESHRPPRHPLLDYPTGGRVDAERVRRALIEAVASSYTPAEAPLVVAEANAMRIEAEPDDPNASVIRTINLPDPSTVAPMQYWMSVFTEARLQGPRMLAALLLTVSVRAWSRESLALRKSLLEFLVSLR